MNRLDFQTEQNKVLKLLLMKPYKKSPSSDSEAAMILQFFS